jgi:hypothetical protein
VSQIKGGMAIMEVRAMRISMKQGVIIEGKNERADLLIMNERGMKSSMEIAS